MARNVLGSELEPCGFDPLTGFMRDGCCDAHSEDLGVHLVCARMTDEFLAFSTEQGNDLVTAVPEYGFAGLKAGDRWCLCASRRGSRRRSTSPPPTPAPSNGARWKPCGPTPPTRDSGEHPPVH
jgi:uncharacterized protein (DUF2237 family)